MKAFEYQDIPGHDDTFYLGRANKGYKVVISAAFNYDKPVVMAETYAAYRKLDEDTFFGWLWVNLPWASICKIRPLTASCTPAMYRDSTSTWQG
jgi:hypothetical protein